jgi:type II secretory ATPase GspE/PulE/Tfp pilus assembly ATPase PilB-like protein
VFELVLGTPEFRVAVAKASDYLGMVEAAKRQGYRTMLEDGKFKAMSGWTTPEEIIKAVYTQAM